MYEIIEILMQHAQECVKYDNARFLVTVTDFSRML